MYRYARLRVAKLMMTDWMYSWPEKMAMFSAMMVLADSAQICTATGMN